MTNKEYKEYVKILEPKYGTPMTIEQLKDRYYDCQKLTIDSIDLLKKSMQMNEELIKSNNIYKEVIEKLLKEKKCV